MGWGTFAVDAAALAAILTAATPFLRELRQWLNTTLRLYQHHSRGKERDISQKSHIPAQKASRHNS